MSTTVDQLMVTLGLDSSKFSAGMKASEDALKKFEGVAKSAGDKLIGFGTSAALWGTALAGAGLVAAGAIAKAGIDIGASLQDMSDQLGMSALQYRALSDNAEEAGLSMGKVNKAIISLNSSVASAVGTGGAAAQAFHDLGLNLGQLSVADTDEKIRLVADAVKNATTETEKMSIATAAFGAQGGKMVRWLSQGREGLDAAAAGFRSVHGAVDAMSFAKLQVARNALGDINDVLDTMKMLFAEALVPYIVAAAKALEGFVASKNGLEDVRTKVSDISKLFVKLGGDFTQGTSIIYNEMGELVATIGVGAWQIVKVFTQAGSIIWDVLSRPLELFQKLWQSIVANIQAQASAMVGVFAELADYVGMEGTGEKLHKVEAALQAVADSAQTSADAIASVDTSTPMIDEMIDSGREVARMYRDQATALEESAANYGTWGDAAVAAIDGVVEGIDEEAAKRVAADEASRGSAAAMAAENAERLAADIEGAKEYFSTLIQMSTSAYQIMFDSELAANAERERVRQEALVAYEQDQNSRIAALQARLDVENEIESESEEGKLLRRKDIDARIMEIRAQQLEDERSNQDANTALWESGWRGRMDLSANFLGQMSALMQSSNKKMFEVGKAAAIGETVINTYKAATAAYSSLAGIPIVGPALGAAAAAAAVVAGMANVSRISSTQFGGGGGGAGGAGGGGGSSAPASGGGGGGGTQAPQINRNINVSMQGDKFSANQVRALISHINDATDDNTTLKVQAA